MDIENTSATSVARPVLLRPWFVLLAGLALYGLTLNHWVTFASLANAAEISGWDWHPGPLAWKPGEQHPLFLILTWPLRWLAPASRPIGLNVFTAACASLTLAVLARSVNLLVPPLPQGRAARKLGPVNLDWLPSAFLPAGFAALLLATQMTFWQNAISGTGQMLNLLVFAFLILCLLEFRASQRQGWLILTAFVYGVGMPDDWALIGYFPCFFTASVLLVWKERVAIFSHLGDEGGTDGTIMWKWFRSVVSYNWKFVLKILGAGVLGLAMYGLIPLVGAAHGDGGFWMILRQKLTEQQFFLTRMPRYFTLIAAMMTLVPAIFARIANGFRDDDVSPGAGFTREMIRLLNLLCLAVGVLMFFDVKFSPSPRNMGMGVTPGTPGFLTFYYLAALNVGYFGSSVLRVYQTAATKAAYSILARSGYNLLVFGRTGIPRSKVDRWFWSIRDGAMVGLLWAAAIAFPAILFKTNVSQIRDGNSPAIAQYGKDLALSMPSTPAIVLADDPARLYLAMGARQTLGLPDQYAFIETRSLFHRDYVHYLANRFPSLGPTLSNLDCATGPISERQVADLLANLVQHDSVFYLHPSSGSSFERICMTPHGLGGNLHPAPANLLENLSLSTTALAANQDFWRQREKESFASLTGLARTNLDAGRIAGYYAQALDYWGVELQKAGARRKLPSLVEEASHEFREAVLLDTNNIIARVNEQANAHLRGAATSNDVVATADLVASWSGHWDVAMSDFGPPDAPELNFAIGRDLAEHGLYLQAARLLQRGLELAPGNGGGELDLANAYVNLGLPDSAEALLRDMRQRAAGNPMDLVEIEALACVTKDQFGQADKLLTEARGQNPKDSKFAAVTAEIYRMMGYRALRAGRENPQHGSGNDAAVWFGKALSAFNDQLQSLTKRTADVRSIELATLRKAEMQRMIAN